MTVPAGMEAPPSRPRKLGDPEDDALLAERVRGVVLATPGVAGMGHGRLAEAATYWVGRKIMGVVVRPDELEVHVVARYPEAFPLAKLDRHLRERLRPLAGERLTNIVIEDLTTALEPPADDDEVV